MIIRSMLEALAVILVIVGVYYEKELIAFENKMILRFCKFLLRKWEQSGHKLH